jgi:hypothetical protein
VTFTFFSLGYEKPYSLKRLVRGIAIGTIAILAVYGLFPEHLRFSRGLIILGSFWAIIEMTATRLFANYFTKGKFTLGDIAPSKILIIGGPQEARRVYEMLYNAGTAFNFMGYVLTEKNQNDPQVLGHLTQLEEIVNVFKPEELIFCNKDISSKAILEWMVKLGSKKVHYKIAPEASSFIIGSNSKNTSGEFFTEAINLRLSDAGILRKKRWFDFISSIILLAGTPLWYVFVKERNLKLKFILQVISGKKTWVSYAPISQTLLLPPLRTGIFNASQVAGVQSRETEILEKINFRYARYYSVEIDLQIVWNNFF